jgi:hypothetical protein
MTAPAALHINPHFRSTLADAFPPADADSSKSLIADAALKLVYDKTVAARFAEQSRDNAVGQVSNQIRSHLNTPHGLVPKTYEADMDQSTSLIPRTKQEPSSQWLKDKIQIKQRVATALKADHSHKHSHLKLIAREAGASPRTVEGWTSAQYLPGLEHFLRLIPKSPAIQKMLAELMTLDADTDPRHAVLLAQIQRQG